MQSQRGEVLDRALVRELKADVGGLDLRDRQLPAARLAHRILGAMLEGTLRNLGQILVRGQEVVLQAQPPLPARLEVDRDAERAVGIGKPGSLGRSPDQATADEVPVLVTGLEAVGADPPGVEVCPPLPGSVAHLEQVGEVALQRDLQEHRDGRA